jgi:large subunit ribosomal protein L7/L12
MKYEEAVEKINEILDQLDADDSIKAAAEISSRLIAAPAYMAPGVPEDGIDPFEGADPEGLYIVILKDTGSEFFDFETRVKFAKKLRELNPALGLKEASEILDSLPYRLRGDYKRWQADDIEEEFEKIGAAVEVIPKSSYRDYDTYR